MDEMDGLGDGFGYTEPNWGKDRPNRPIVKSQSDGSPSFATRGCCAPEPKMDV